MELYLSLILAGLSFITGILMVIRVIQKRDYTIVAGILSRALFIITTMIFVSHGELDHNAIGWAMSGVFLSDIVISLGYILSKKYRMIIENARLQKILEDIKYKYKILLETMPIGVYVLDDSGKIEFVNKYLLNLFGYELSEVLYRPIVNFVADCDKELVSKSIKQRLSKEVISDAYCISLVRKDGSTVRVKIHSNLTINGHPTITGSIIPEEIASCRE